MSAIAPSTLYQYRTFDRAYTLKIKPDTVKSTLYIRDPHGAPPKKIKFSLADHKITKLELSDDAVVELLTRLYPEGFPKPLGIDASTLASEFSTLSQGIHDRLRALEKADDALLQKFLSQPSTPSPTVSPISPEIGRLIASRNLEEQAARDLLDIRKDPLLDAYYRIFYQKLTGICLASYTISSGWIKNGQKQSADYALQALKCAEQLPIVGSAVHIISLLLEQKISHDKTQAVERLMAFFYDFDDSLKQIKTLSRLLTKEQESNLRKTKPLGWAAKKLDALKAWVSGESAKTPEIALAIENVDAFITAILREEVDLTTPLANLVAHVLNRPPETSHPPVDLQEVPQAAPSAPPPTSPHTDAANRDERCRALEAQMSALRTEYDELKRRVAEPDTQIAELREAVAQLRRENQQLRDELSQERKIAVHQVRQDLGHQGARMQDLTDLVIELRETVVQLQDENRRLKSELSRTRK